jgi:hypothetical protein
MRRELVEKILSTLYPDKNINIIHYEVLEKNRLDENNNWVIDTPAIFMDVKFENYDNKEYYFGGSLSEELTKFTGYEFAITKI